MPKNFGLVTLLAAVAVVLTSGCAGGTPPVTAPSELPVAFPGGVGSTSPAAVPSATPPAAPMQTPAEPPSAAPTSAPTPVLQTGARQIVDLAPGQASVHSLPAGSSLLLALLRPGSGLAPLSFSLAATGPLLRTGHHARRPIPASTGRKLLQTRTLADTEDFWVNRGAFNEATDTKRTCRRVATRDGVHLYADLDAKGDRARLAGLLDTFVTETRPKLEAVYGPLQGPWSGSGPIALVISPAVDDFGARVGALAYFWARDVMPEQPRSNQVAALFISDDLLRRPAVVRRAVLAHETTHLLSFARKSQAAKAPVDEPDFLDEALATNGPDLVGAGFGDGYPHTNEDIADFERAPEAEGLTAWFTGAPGVSFGRAYLFMRYARDRFGDRILHDLVATPRTGLDAWADALKPHNTDYAALAAEWVGAIAHASTPGSRPPAHPWRGPALVGTDAGVTMPGLTWLPLAGPGEASPRAWGMTFRRAEGPGPWRLDLRAPAGDRLLGTLVTTP